MPFNNKPYAKIALTIAMLITILLLAISCKECPSEPKPEPEYNIYLSVEDVLCTWVTLKVTLPDSGKVNTFALERNDSTVATYTCYDDDTLIIDEGLIPDKDYSYTVRFLKDVKTKAESEPVTVHTLPTTSHDFIWEIDTLGNYGSYLKDVWIVDENNIWVVGEIIVPDPDSSWNGTGFETFNAAHWNGSHWNLSRFERGAPLNSIWYFSENDIWASGGVPIHWDGDNWDFYHLWDMGVLDHNDGGVEHIWASSPDDIYFVGRKGSIVHYNGSTFSKMESGTDIDLTDIYGYDRNHIWACGQDMASMKSIILRFDGSKWQTIYERYHPDGTSNLTDEHPGSPAAYTLWVYPNSSILWFDGGTDIYQISQSLFPSTYTDLNVYPQYPQLGFPRRIRGNGNNDVFSVGDNRAVHWNGQTWQAYEEILNNYRQREFDGLFVKDDFIVMVGNENSEIINTVGIVIRGRRN